jgi:Lar family restriction alleviation protein
MQNDKLLSCPFCGGEANVIGYKTFYAQCTECGVATGFYNTIEQTNEAWNTRKPMERIVEQLEEVKINHFLTIANTGDDKLDFAYEKVGNALDKAIEIVKGGLDNAE